jgi:hypothetical protein
MMNLRKHNKPRVLLLGMYYSLETRPLRGQGFRDGVRCESLENLGYDVYTLDDKHDYGEFEIEPGKHCKANFADTRRMSISIYKSWGFDISFDLIILDYFFSPVSLINYFKYFY